MKDMKKAFYRFAQREFGIKDDGIIGPVTRSYANKLPRLIPAIKREWYAQRKLITLRSRLINRLVSEGWKTTEAAQAIDQILK